MKQVVIQKYGDRDKDCGYSVHDYSNCIPSNPMSDRGQLVLEIYVEIDKEEENDRAWGKKLKK